MHLDEERDADGTVRKPGQDYYLKPMNCPMHNLIFRSRGRSYRELPLRLFEFGSVYRYEKSGVVHGLTRARGFTQDDAHIYCTREQMQGEIRSLLQFVLDLLRDYGLDDFYLELSTRDPEKSIGERRGLGAGHRRRCARPPRPAGWTWCSTPAAPPSTRRRSACRPRTRSGAPGRCPPSRSTSWSPELFDLEYTAADGSRQRPVMIHRALFGSIERFFGVLTEHYAGAFPAWLAPVQVVAIPVTDEQVPHVEDGRGGSCARAAIRVEVDASDDRMQKKIRTHTLQKVPFMLLVGGARRRGGRGELPVPRRQPAQRGAGRRRRRHRRRLDPQPRATPRRPRTSSPRRRSRPPAHRPARDRGHRIGRP